jgi:8-oxo-dGTP pyrophosphatase MutT (NUDIX family)
LQYIQAFTRVSSNESYITKFTLAVVFYSMVIDISLIESRLLPIDSDEGQPEGVAGRQAAVLVPLVNYGQYYSLLLTKRAANMSHHGGEIAFPGGMWEIGDVFPVATALREAEEELALRPHDVELLGRLPALDTRNGTLVTPVVAIIQPELLLIPSPAEIEQVFYVPLAALSAHNRIRTDIFSRNGVTRWSPAYEYQGHEIWGFTAGVIKMLLERCFNATFNRDHPAPEKIW